MDNNDCMYKNVARYTGHGNNFNYRIYSIVFQTFADYKMEHYSAWLILSAGAKADIHSKGPDAVQRSSEHKNQ